MSKGTGGPSGDEAQNLVLTPTEIAATLNSGGNDGGFRTEPGEHLVVSALTRHVGTGADDNFAQAGHLIEQEVFAFAENQRAELRTSDIALQLTAGGGKPGQGYGAVFERGRYAVHNGDDVCVSEDQALSVTASKGNPGAITDIGMVRKLTVIECLRLQGFPDDWFEADGTTEEAHAREILHRLWQEAGTQAREGWRSGIAASLLTPEVLLAGVYGSWVSWEVAAKCAATRGSASGADSWSEGFVRSMREYAQHRPSPHRRESFEQLARELGRSLSELPLEGAQARAALRGSRLWPQAQTQWPLRHARPESQSGKKATSGQLISDTRAYRALGNAVSVPVVNWIARRMADVHQRIEPKGK